MIPLFVFVAAWSALVYFVYYGFCRAVTRAVRAWWVERQTRRALAAWVRDGWKAADNG